MLESRYLKDNAQNIQQLMGLFPLNKLNTEHLKLLAKISKIREYDPEEVIIREGEMDRWIYFLLSGKVRVEKQGVPVAVINNRGALFGEVSILDYEKRSASVIALTNTLCLAVNLASHHRLPFVHDLRKFHLKLYRIFAAFSSIRLRSTTEELVKAKQVIEKLSEVKTIKNQSFQDVSGQEHQPQSSDKSI